MKNYAGQKGVAQHIMRRSAPRPKGTALFKRDSKQNSKANSVIHSAVQSDVEDEFDRDLQNFVEQLTVDLADAQGEPLDHHKSDFPSDGLDGSTMDKDKVIDATEVTKLREQKDIEAQRTARYNANFEILVMPRQKSSQALRNGALESICNALSNKYDPEMYRSGDLETLFRSFSSGRTNEELSLAIRAVVLLSALNIEESAEFLQEHVLPYLYTIITDDDRNPTLRASVVTGYGLLQTMINTGSQGFGLDEKVKGILDVATGAFASSEPSQAILATASLTAIGLIVSAIEARNRLIEEILPEVIELLKSNQGEIVNAAGKLIALLYELYDYGYQYDESTYEDSTYTGVDGFRYQIPTVENGELIYEIKAMSDTQGSKFERGIKQEQRSVFRKILAFLEVHLQVIDSKKAYTEEGRLLAMDEAISHVRLSRNKAIKIETWNQLFLSSALKWLYAGGLATQLANNDLIIDLVNFTGPDEHPDYPSNAIPTPQDEMREDAENPASAKYIQKEKQRDTEIQKRRSEKMDFLQHGEA